MTVPSFTYYVPASGPVAVRRSASTLYSVGFRWSGASGSGSFVFEFDVDEVTIPNTGWFSIYSLQLIPGSAPTISQGSGTAPTLAAGKVTRQWDKPVPRPVDPTWKMDFWSNLVAGFVINKTGFDVNGKPCFKDILAQGNFQQNGESGIYTDPATDGTNPFQISGGKRLLCPEKLAAPVTVTNGSYSSVRTYSSPSVSTETNGLFGYGRFEYAFALRSPQQGMWPAGWSVCQPHQRWPDCEMDTFEIMMNSAAAVASASPVHTHWWTPANGDRNSPQHEGMFSDVFALIPNFSWNDVHTIWSEWTSTQMRWGVDNLLVFSAPNSFVLANPSDPNDPNRLYMMLQIALGGAGGDCSQGVYPVAPSQHALGQPCMLVDHMAHYAMPA